MSSLAAAQADGYYYPPGWDPSKGSLNKYNKSHPLRERARKIDQGIIIVRFEMPYNSFCEGCGRHIAMGVRFNAEKKTIDHYFTTPILEFSMKCPSCDQRMMMKTDPKNAEYVCVSGIRKKVETYEASSAETVELKDNETAQKLESDPLFRLEYKEKDKAKARSREADIADAMEMQKTLKDDFGANSTLRRQMRQRKHQLREEQEQGKKRGLVVPLEPAQDLDYKQASSVHFAKDDEDRRYSKAAKRQRQRVLSRSILPTSTGKHGENHRKYVRVRDSATPPLTTKTRNPSAKQTTSSGKQEEVERAPPAEEDSQCSPALSAIAGYSSESDA
eukprot:gb/GECG01011959.1/.p1 GENE.gb/GECG01011959.1/~~gb/GECG01011959.1/.p1  ORF type:complete len:332 (+),score=56.86 gb/GECG01011959.1/:1-996(+)